MASEAGTPVLPTALPMTGVAAGASGLRSQRPAIKVGDFPHVSGPSVSVQSTAGRNSGRGRAVRGRAWRCGRGAARFPAEQRANGTRLRFDITTQRK